MIERGRAGGPLEGLTFATKDLFDVAGTRTGAGNPAWLAHAPVATRHADVVAALIDAGATLMGKTATDEFAWSISGTNAHYGTAPNPAAPGRAPGGSSSGSASAVTAGTVDIGLGSDTGGSIRVPASYCGISGFRPTHGRISVRGMVPLAPSFDTVGFLARSPQTLRRVWRALAHPVRDRRPITRIVIAADVVARCDPGVEESVRAAASALVSALGLELVDAPLATDITEWTAAFRVLQSAEVWAAHGAWITEHRPPLGAGVAERVAYAQTLTPDDVRAALPARAAAGARLRELLDPGGVLLLPAAPGPAHRLDLDGAEKAAVRAWIFACTVAAPLAGAPSIALPRATGPGGLPVGICLLGLPGDDDVLLDLATASQTDT